MRYDHLHDDEAFRDAVGETVLQVKLGSTQCAPSPALRMLVEQLLDLEPARRATVDQLCEAAYFDLVLPNAEGGRRIIGLVKQPVTQSSQRQPLRQPMRRVQRRVAQN